MAQHDIYGKILQFNEQQVNWKKAIETLQLLQLYLSLSRLLLLVSYFSIYIEKEKLMRYLYKMYKKRQINLLVFFKKM